jgi:hypothetical protein
MAYVGEFVSSKKNPKKITPPPRRVTEYLEKANM